MSSSSSSNGLLLADPFLTPATLALQLWSSGHDAWTPERHLLYASSRIVQHIMSKAGRLCVSMPPRHGKTRLIAEATIPWFLERFPGRHVMYISYNQEMADEYGGKIKDVINTHGDLFSYRIRHDRARVEQFETTTGSIVRFSGINTGQTGKGAHLIVIDDYIKGIDAAMSATERESMWLKFLANIYTRLEPGAIVIIMATRWHSDDLIGRVMTKTKEFEYICFPAICEDENDILGRVRGEALFPSRYPIVYLDTVKALNTGTVIFEALYQQKPIDSLSEFANGAWLKVVPADSPWLEGLTEVRAWDFAATQGAGDFTCGTRCGRKGLTRQMYVRNVIKKQLSPFRIEELIRATAVADGRDVTVLMEVEPGSQAASLLEHYKMNVLPEFDVVGVPAGNRSKLIKAQPVLAAAESGAVYMEEGEWNGDFREAFGKFPPPSGHGDEEVDTMAMCYNHLFQVDLQSPVWGRKIDGGVLAGRAGGGGTLDADLNAVYQNKDARGREVRGVVWGSNRHGRRASASGGVPAPRLGWIRLKG